MIHTMAAGPSRRRRGLSPTSNLTLAPSVLEGVRGCTCWCGVRGGSMSAGERVPRRHRRGPPAVTFVLPRPARRPRPPARPPRDLRSRLDRPRPARHDADPPEQRIRIVQALTDPDTARRLRGQPSPTGATDLTTAPRVSAGRVRCAEFRAPTRRMNPCTWVTRSRGCRMCRFLRARLSPAVNLAPSSRRPRGWSQPVHPRIPHRTGAPERHPVPAGCSTPPTLGPPY
jgi:hypothetical protein